MSFQPSSFFELLQCGLDQTKNKKSKLTKTTLETRHVDLATFLFLSDPSPIIGYACHSLTNSLTNSLTHSCLVNLIDVTLACEDANSKLVEVVTVADVDA